MWKVEWFEVLQSRLFLEMVGLYFLYNKKTKGIPLNTLWSGKLLATTKKK
jgi:hypothetical protein